MQVETLLERSCESVGEGPHWDERTQQLLYVDINAGGLHRWTAATGVDEKHTFGELHCFVILVTSASNHRRSVMPPSLSGE